VRDDGWDQSSPMKACRVPSRRRESDSGMACGPSAAARNVRCPAMSSAARRGISSRSSRSQDPASSLKDNYRVHSSSACAAMLTV